MTKWSKMKISVSFVNGSVTNFCFCFTVKPWPINSMHHQNMTAEDLKDFQCYRVATGASFSSDGFSLHSSA